MIATLPAVATVSWHLPDMLERPVVGTTCCVSTAEAIVAQELSMLPGIQNIEVDVERGQIDITYLPVSVTPDDLADALSDVGYPPAR